MSSTGIDEILTCFCFEIMLISFDFICFKFCIFFEDLDSYLGTLAVEFIGLFDLSVMHEGIG